MALTKNFSHSVVYLTWQQTPENTQCVVQGTLSENKTIDLDLTFDAVQNESVEDRSDGAIDTDSQSTQPTVVVVDDDEQFSDILFRVLQRRGYHTHRFADARFAFEAIRDAEIEPQLIISDVHLPATDGGDLLELLRQNGNHTPVILLTSDEDEILEAELIARGADAFLRKHEDVRVLLAWCKNLLLRGAVQRAEGLEDAA